MKDAGNSAFVCPNDRQLQLRAKLNSGWSFHSGRPAPIGAAAAAAAARLNNSIISNTNQTLRDEELERIKKVLDRAQRIEVLEQERVGKLIDRLENMKKHANGNGSTQCVLCADGFGMLGASSVLCVDCHKAVCNKCSIETIYNQQVITLCKICSENRELWKKSGAWFFRTLPTRASLPANVKASPQKTSVAIVKNHDTSSDDDSSSDERRSSKTGRLAERHSPLTALPSNPYPTVNSFQPVFETTNSIDEPDRDGSIDSSKADEQSCKELSIEEYFPKTQSIRSPSSSIISGITPSPSNIRPSNSVIVNTSSPIDDCGFGTLDFEVIWKESLNVLTITLIRARNLRSCDSNGLSDPYVKLHLVPGVAKATKLRSHTIRRTLNPDFDETLVYNGISLDDIKNRTLKFSVYDEDSVGSDFLGEYRLKLSTIRPDAREAYSIYLQNKTELPTDEDKNERGKILLSLMYSKSTSNFHVKVIRGCQLLPMDFGQTSDPYCKLSLFPSIDMNIKWNFKTSVKKHTLQPEYNEEFIFQHIQLQDLISRTLQITVYDKDMGKKDDYIGGFQLGQSASGDDLKHWLLMVRSPDQWIEMWHKLKPEQFHTTLNQRDSQISR
ncbi:hypothetical protein I4U23_000609 [Adineta vaga]|nr:hypothetical protein I4U23_000609 [Adineta vaga]